MKKLVLIFLAAVAFMSLKTLMQVYSEYSVAILAAAMVVGGGLWAVVARFRKKEPSDE